MVRGPQLQTQRLSLRRWRKDDLKPFAALNGDPDVMEHFPSVMTEDRTADMISWIEEHFEKHGFGLWAVENTASGDLVGFTGLAIPSFEAEFMPAVEVGWRLGKEHWGKGYATEAARAALAYGFDEAGLEHIVSFTIPANTRSTMVMERLGMTHDVADDFDHPAMSADSPLRRHVLYRMSATDWARSNRP
jgi:RimJ/RimL family protein N-acetyltransferase